MISLLFLITCKQIELPPRPNLPDISVLDGSNNMVSGYTFQFADVVEGNYSTVTFTVKNSGTKTLNLSGLPLLKSGNTGFALSAPSFTLVLEPEASTSFTVTFTPSAQGNFSDKIEISSDDPDEPVFYLNLLGKAIPPSTNTGDPNLALSFNPASGSFTSSVSVSITSLDPTASIYYTIDGTNPSCNGGGTLYQSSAGLTLTSSATVNAIACGTNGAYYTANTTYTINSPVTAPSITPATGTYSTAQTVQITLPAGAVKINYTQDGTTPSCAVGTSSTQSVSLSVYQTTTVKAVACDSNGNASSVSESAITISLPAGTLASPTFSVNGVQVTGGSYNSDIPVTISAETGTTVYYSLDADITCGQGTLYESGLTLSLTVEGNNTIKAIACKDGASSALSTAVFVKDTTPPVLSTRSPAENTLIRSDQSITLSFSEPVQNPIITTNTMGSITTSYTGSQFFITNSSPGSNKTLVFKIEDSLGNLSPEITVNYHVTNGTFYVTSDDTTIPEYGTPENPFKTIQTAIDKAYELYPNTSSTVKVQTGTYNEDVVLANGVSLSGSFDASWTSQSCVSNETVCSVIQGQSTSLGSNLVPTATLTIGTGAATPVVIEGFDIRGSETNTSDTCYIAGIGLTSSSATIQNNRIWGRNTQSISSNSVSTKGIHISGINGGLIQNNYITGGSGKTSGWGIYAASSNNFTIKNNYILGAPTTNNNAVGIYLSTSSPTIQENPEIIGALKLSSTVFASAQGIYVFFNSNPNILNNPKILGLMDNTTTVTLRGEGIKINLSYTGTGTETISGNTIIGTESSNNLGTGITISSSFTSNAQNHPIKNNTILASKNSTLSSSEPFYGINIDTGNSSPLILNNVIHGGSNVNNPTYGIYVNSNPSSIMKIYNNTILAGNPSNSYGFSGVSSAINYEMINNLIKATIGIEITTPDLASVIKNNNIDADFIFRISGANATLNGNTQITASGNLNMPLLPSDFISVADFSSFALTYNYSLSDNAPTLLRAKGLGLAEVTADKNNTARSPSNPTIGAYENSNKNWIDTNLSVTGLNGGTLTDIAVHESGWEFFTADDTNKLYYCSISGSTAACTLKSIPYLPSWLAFFKTSSFYSAVVYRPESSSLTSDYYYSSSFQPYNSVITGYFTAGLAFNSEGSLFYFIDTSSKIVHKMDYTSGTFSNRTNFIPSGLSSPEAIAVDPDGSIYVTDFASSQWYIKKFNNSGAPIGSPVLIASPKGITVDKNGLVYIAQQDQKQIYIFDSSLTTSYYSISGLPSAPYGVRVDNNGFVYVTVGNTVKRFR